VNTQITPRHTGISARPTSVNTLTVNKDYLHIKQIRLERPGPGARTKAPFKTADAAFGFMHSLRYQGTNYSKAT
jgi:hypothetical protein